MDISIGVMMLWFVVVIAVIAATAYECGWQKCKTRMTAYHEEEMEKLRKIKIEEWLYPDRAVLDQPYSEES
jgi:hypothetical protein